MFLEEFGQFEFHIHELLVIHLEFLFQVLVFLPQFGHDRFLGANFMSWVLDEHVLIFDEIAFGQNLLADLNTFQESFVSRAVSGDSFFTILMTFQRFSHSFYILQ